MAQTDPAGVSASANREEPTTGLPDGPNVGPSPYEHLAAQGDPQAAKPVSPAAGQAPAAPQSPARKPGEDAAQRSGRPGAEGEPASD